jgi:hypothetical protein
MENQNIENDNSLNVENAEKELEAILNAPDEATKLQEINKKLFARAKKAEEELRTIKTSKPKEEEVIINKPAQTDDMYENIFYVKDLSKDEFSSLSSEAKSLGVDPFRYMKSTAGKFHLESIRNEAKSKDASVETPSVSRVFKNYTQEDLSKMSVADLEKILPKA